MKKCRHLLVLSVITKPRSVTLQVGVGFHRLPIPEQQGIRLGIAGRDRCQCRVGSGRRCCDLDT
jgi:hypothetical protein